MIYTARLRNFDEGGNEESCVITVHRTLDGALRAIRTRLQNFEMIQVPLLGLEGTPGKFHSVRYVYKSLEIEIEEKELLD